MNGYDLLLCMNDVDNKHIVGAVRRKWTPQDRALCAGLLLLLVMGVLLFRTPADIRYGCNVHPTLTINNVTYMLAEKSLAPDDSFVYMDTIDVAFSSDGGSEYKDAQVWISHDDDTRVYVKNGSGWALFVREEMRFQWICYQNCLYVYADHYETHYLNCVESYDSAVLEDGAVFLDNLTFSEHYRLPTRDFTTNTLELDGYRVFYCEGNDYLIVEVPDGLSGGKYRYDRFYPILPDAVYSIQN